MRSISLLIVVLLTCSVMTVACQSNKNKPTVIETTATAVEQDVDSVVDDIEEETGIQKDIESAL